VRKKVIAANWKMYKTPDQALAFFKDFLPLVAGHDRDEIVVCPPYLDIPCSIEVTQGSDVAIGAQDLHWEKEGAFTGEICATMLLAVGVTHVIIGHSERRQYFGESDDVVNLKLNTISRPSSASAKFSKSVRPDSPRTFSAASACAPSTPSRVRKRAS